MSFINPTREFSFHKLGEQWFLGDVEVNEDPEKLGRVRVRVPEVHGTRVSKDLLPWATPLRALYRGGLENNGYYSRPDLNSRIVVSFHRGSIYSPLYFAEPRSKLEPTPNLVSSDAGFDSILGDWFRITEAGEVKFHHRSGTEITINENGKVIVDGIDDLDLNISNSMNEEIGAGKSSHTGSETFIDADGGFRVLAPSIQLSNG